MNKTILLSLLLVLSVLIAACATTEIKKEVVVDTTNNVDNDADNTVNDAANAVNDDANAVNLDDTNTDTANSATDSGSINSNDQQTPDATESDVAASESQTPQGITISELSAHDSSSDCWVAYKGEVYDITSYLPKHPGSASKILPYCGTSSEFESAFTKKHGTSQVSKLKSQGLLMGALA